jgi:formate-dependent nitrite reductase cytochrome c552 subunit
MNDDGEIVTMHDMDISLTDHSETCVDCHSELTLAYAQRFLVGQQEETAQRLALIHTRLDDEELPQWVLDAVLVLDADSSGGVHNMPYTESLLHAAELYLGLVEPSNLFSAPEATDPVACAECHAEEHAAWADSTHAISSTNPHFQSVFAENEQPSYCLRCHASGFDANTNTVLFEGVVCSSCHTIEGEHPPAPATMGTNVATCAACHSGGHASVYEEWLASEHQVVGVDCVDCHNAHTNDMLLGDVNTTCGDCHADAMEDEVHMGEDLICIDCHMTPRETVTDPTMLTSTGHSMDISPGVCADCHGATHTLKVESNVADEDPEEVAVLREDLQTWQMTAEENLTSGLLGGAIGVLLVLGLVYIIVRIGRLV